MKFNTFIHKLTDPEMVEKYCSRSSKLCGQELESLVKLSYREVKEIIPDMFENGKYEEVLWLAVKHCKKNITFTKVKRANNYDKIKFLFWIQDQFKMIAKLEEQYIHLPPEADQVAAGINELDEMGNVNLIDALADGDILKWELIKDLPYEKIFDKQRKTTIETKIGRRQRANSKRKK
jgi:hypothetical protein